MAAYAVLERYRNPQESWTDLGVTHLWHVAFLTLLLYAVLVAGFNRLVGRPLRAIHAHLYMVATGRLEILRLDARVKEIADMVASVNLMVRRMARRGRCGPSPHRARSGTWRRGCDEAPEARRGHARPRPRHSTLLAPSHARRTRAHGAR
jgi:HAMP domain-containing protein